jgi:hypothetical protein
VEKLCETAWEPYVSREALSLDISRVVSRVVSGEHIDTAENGAALAAKYPDLGISPALISQAIDRAAGMVGMIKSAPEPVKGPRLAVAMPAPKAAPATNGNGHALAVKKPEPVTVRKPEPPTPAPAMPVAAMPVGVLSIEDDLAAAIDAEIGNLVAGQKTKPAEAVDPPVVLSRSSSIHAVPATPLDVAVSPAAETVEMQPEAVDEEPEPATEDLPDFTLGAELDKPKDHEPQKGSLFSSFRRALFRS